MRAALESLQFVDKKKSIDVDVGTQQVIFTVTDKKKFDFEKVQKALAEAGYNDAKLLSGPK